MLHFYELIRGPCHLYLDLEYYRAANPGRDGERMVATLLTALRSALRAEYDGYGPGWVPRISKRTSVLSGVLGCGR